MKTKFGKLKDGEEFFFDHGAMSAPRAANRPRRKCVKVCNSIGDKNLGYFKEIGNGALYLADRSDFVISA